jgi:hypothetical protein
MTCETCSHWKPDHRRKRNPPERGTCDQMTGEWIKYSCGCSECDPYSMTQHEVQTPRDFSCKMYQKAEHP